MFRSRRWTATRETFALFTLLVTAAAPSPHALQAQSAPPDASNWTVNAQPRTVFGQIEGGLGGEFVAVVDVVRGVDGRIAVADNATSAISFFSPDGDLLASKGRRGEGPGEFATIRSLVADPEGRLFVFDEGYQRISEFSLEGEFVGDTRLIRGPDDRQIGGLGRFEDGSWYAWESTHVILAEVDGLAQDTVGFYRFTGGEVGEPLARVRGPVSTAFKVFGSHGVRYALYSPRVLRASRGTCLVVGTSDTPVLSLVDRNGTQLDELRLETTVDRTTSEHRQQWISASVERGGKRANLLQRMMIRRAGNRVQMADWVPFAHHMVVDELGYIWVQRYQPPEGRGSPDWQVFTETGAAVGTVTLPARLHVIEITADDLVGVQTDELGQQDVRIFSLDRGRDTEIRPLHPGCAPGPTDSAATSPPGSPQETAWLPEAAPHSLPTPGSARRGP